MKKRDLEGEYQGMSYVILSESSCDLTPELVEQVNPDAVIVATGSSYVHPPIPGIDLEKVKTVSDVENHRTPVGEQVVVCGGGIVGLECAVMLGMEGKKVTVIDQIPLEKFAD